MATLNVGDMLDDRYRIDYPIARGGMSTVYRCVDIRLGREVAAKVMDEKFADDPIYRDRFRREARAMAQLSHPNLVSVYDFSSGDDAIFLIMELITGGTLRELLAERGPMPPHAAATVMRAMLTGLAVAHTQGLIHRDIKPDNILISANHTVKVADFGLVRAQASSNHSTDSIIGTVSYLSPEQVDGSEITPASDVYQAGIVLFELLTGTTPFSGDTAIAHAMARLREDVPSPSSLIDGVPPLVDELVATATARNPEHRFADAGEFLAALDDVADELNLPSFTVPIPRNSAAHRAAAVPTNIEGIIASPAQETGSIDPHPKPTMNSVPTTETRMMPESGATPLSAQPAEPPAQPPAPRPAPVPAPEPKPMSNRSPWRLTLGIAVAIAVIAATLVGAWWFGSGRYSEIPQVIGMDKDQAVSQIQGAGFTPKTEDVYDNTVPANKTVSVDPQQGSKSLPGHDVTLKISQGRPTVPAVPEGMSVEDYHALAKKRTLDVRTGDSIFDPAVPAGSIVSTDPGANTAVEVGSTVTVHLSKGPQPVTIPDVIGMSQNDAEIAIKDAGLNVGDVSTEYSSKVAGGHVISADPGPGASVKKGDKVSLKVSNAKSIPDVTGKTKSDAEKILNDAGFEVKTTRDSSRAASDKDKVLSMSPSSGTSADPGSKATVTLTLPGKVSVPDLSGMTVSEASNRLSDIGLRASAPVFKGNQTVKSQDPKTGSEVSVGTTVKLTTK